ncbi:MAG: DUF481 domain-containing protein [Opitutales bacterium]|nr:DUF481 domain-containing protein [Opitutales bacterium]
MKSKIISIIAVSMLASLSANAEIITLSNGDRISGKVSQANDAQIVLTTQFGDITIPRESITAISADANSPTVSQTVAETPAPAPAETASASDSTPPPEEKEPQWITDYRQFIKDNFPETWQFRFRGGLENRETTSSVFSAYFALDAKREWDLNKFSATAYYNYTTEESVAGVESTTLDKYGLDTSFRHDFDESSHWYVQNILNYKRDRVKGIKDQVDEAVTLGYRIEFERYDLTIDIAPGPAIRYINADNFDTKWVAMGVIAEDLNWVISKLLKLEQNLYVGMDLTDTSQYSAYFRLGLVVHATDVMDIALRYSYDYDAVNASTAEKTEQRLLLSFEFPFNWK